MACSSLIGYLGASLHCINDGVATDPACGAGALLIAYANECIKRHINYQQSVLFVAQDIDLTAGMMCYIQLSLLGCPGYVVIQDTLSKPATAADNRGLIPVDDSSNVWYTPMYCMAPWSVRRKCSKLTEIRLTLYPVME